MIRRVACLLLAAVAAGADPTDDLLLKARHAQYVRGDHEQARRLYLEALRDPSLDRGRQAEIHLRIALCCEGLGEPEEALHHLAPHIFEADAVGEGLRREADEARRRIGAMLPRPVKAEPKGPDMDALRREERDRHLRNARRALALEDEVRALWHVQWALKLDPEHAEAKTLAARLETRLWGVADFVRDPLQFVSTWTEARVTQVAGKAEALLLEAVEHAEQGAFNLAESSFRQAIEAIDACEFRHESDRLAALRQRVRERWRDARARALGEERAEPAIPAATHTKTLRGQFLDHLQRMLDLLSGSNREYRILPVRAPRATAAGWLRRPADVSLFRELPSRWTPALFAQRYVPARVRPDSWTREGNYVEAAGDMLVARNRPDALDDVQAAVARLARPEPADVRGVFLLVPVPREALGRIAAELDAEVSERGSVLRHVAGPGVPLDALCAFLRDLGAEVRPAHDTFEVELTNGAPQTLFAARSLLAAHGYAGYRPAAVPPSGTHFGVLLDLYPLRERGGRTALLLRVVAQIPAPPLRGPDAALTPRFVRDEAELFADLGPGETLVVAGLEDPFRAARDAGADTCLVLLWSNVAARAAGPPDAPDASGPISADVSLRRLLVEIRDDPGPRVDPERGFVARERVDALAARGRFLEEVLRRELDSPDIDVLVEEGIARVPPALRAAAADKVAQLERESERSYIVRVHTRAVRTAVLERWARREGIALEPFGPGAVGFSDAPNGEFLLRNLEPTEPADVFAPRWAWPKATALGLQLRHGLSARTHTAPVYTTDKDLEASLARTVTEGLRVAVRPFRRGGRLQAHVTLETAGLESETEERALTLAVPSYRTRVASERLEGLLDLGPEARPHTVLIRGIPHPVASRPEQLVEIVVALSVRHVP